MPLARALHFGFALGPTKSMAGPVWLGQYRGAMTALCYPHRSGGPPWAPLPPLRATAWHGKPMARSTELSASTWSLHPPTSTRRRTFPGRMDKRAAPSRRSRAGSGWERHSKLGEQHLLRPLSLEQPCCSGTLGIGPDESGGLEAGRAKVLDEDGATLKGFTQEPHSLGFICLASSQTVSGGQEQRPKRLH